MKRELSVGVILYYQDFKTKKRKYLLLKYKGLTGKTYWGLVKGHKEKKEKILETAKREAKEETGLLLKKFDPHFKKEEKYYFKKNNELILKRVIYFLAPAPSKKIVLSEEHLDYRWVDLKQAQKLIKFKNLKKILEDAENYLQRKSTKNSQKN
ncbi:MAG: NUDIX domain-containing protein [Candidatus Paceibacterota bacterium]